VAVAFVDEHECASWSTAGLTKSSTFTPSASDTLVVFASVYDVTACQLSGIAGGGLTWTNRAQIDGFSTFGGTYIWTAPVASTGSVTITVTSTQASGAWGYNILRYTGVTGFGTGVTNHSSSGQPSAAVTTAAASSVIGWVSSDFNTIDGTVRTYSTATAGAFTEQTYDNVGFTSGVYGGFHANAGAAGAKTVGGTLPTGQWWTIAALEVQGGAAAVVAGPIRSAGQYNTFF
jgi:hypothetical protein